MDTIEREEAGEALRDSELRLRAVITNASAVLFALDNEGVITLSEGKGMEPLGLEPNETVGQSVLNLYHDRPELLEYVRRALACSSAMDSNFMRFIRPWEGPRSGSTSRA